MTLRGCAQRSQLATRALQRSPYKSLYVSHLSTKAFHTSALRSSSSSDDKSSNKKLPDDSASETQRSQSLWQDIKKQLTETLKPEETERFKLTKVDREKITELLSEKPMRSQYPHRLVMWTLMAGGIFVSMAEAHGRDELRSRNTNVWLTFVDKYFKVTWSDLQDNRWWKLFTSSFLCTTPNLLAMNSIMLYWAAPPLIAIMGPTAFIGLYLCSGAVTSLSVLSWRRFNPFNNTESHLNTQEVNIDNLGADGEWDHHMNGIFSYLYSQCYSFRPLGACFAFLTVLALITRPHSVFVYAIVPTYDVSMHLIENCFLYRPLSDYKGREYNGRSPFLAIGSIALGALYWRIGLKRAHFTNIHVGPVMYTKCMPRRLPANK